MTNKLVSYDIWDTVLRRRCHPDAVKVHIAHRLLLRAGDDIRPHLRDAWTLFYMRQATEREIGLESAARGLDDEYAIADVLKRWISSVSSLQNEAVAILSSELLAAELAQEKRISYPDPDICARFLADRAQRRIFVSDFYMPKPFLLELLEQHSLSQYFHDGYVSCDVGLNKRSGRLFEHVLSREKVPADQVTHIGDNAHSDVNAPRRFGIASVMYEPDSEHALRLHKQQRFAKRGFLDPSDTIPAPANAGETGETHPLARQLSSLFVGFVFFIQEQVVRNRLQHVFFLTREGEFFIHLYESLRRYSHFGAELPPASLLEVSRISTFGPSLQTLQAGELMRLWNLYSTQSPRAFLKSLNLPESEFESLLDRHGLAPDQAIQYPWQDERMLRFMHDESFQTKANAVLLTHRRDLLEYCKQQGLHSEIKACGIVDIGWRGTIQDNLAHLLPDVQFHGFYLGLDRFLNVQPINASKHAFGPNLNIEADQGHGHLLDFVAPIEMLTNSPNGSVAGYERTASGIKARRLVDVQENKVYETFTRHFQNEVLRLAESYGNHWGTDSVGSGELRPSALLAWRSVIEKPHPALARAYFSLSHNESFGVGRFVSKSERLSRWWPLGLLLSSKYRRHFRNQLSMLGWTEGYATITGDPLLVPVTKRIFKRNR